MTEVNHVSESAAEYGLRRIGVRPKLSEYVKETRSRREFLFALASARAQSENQSTYLGQLWTVLTPVLNSLVYIFIFGLMLDTTRGLENLIGFIVVGTFTYGLFSSTVTSTAKSIRSNRKLIQALNFPRVLLPFAAALKEMFIQVPGVFVMVVITEISIGVIQGPQHLHPERWLLIGVAMLLVQLFATGIGLLLAKFSSKSPDILNLLPFILRVGMYASGVIFSVSIQVQDGTLLRTLVEYQPVAVFLTLARQSLLSEPSISMEWSFWAYGTAWALVSFVVGFILFWRDETRYGRE